MDEIGRSKDPATIVQAWQEAVNAQDVDTLLALSDPQIEIAGPRGSGFGHQLLRDWLARAGLQLTSQRRFGCGPVVVVAQQAVWHAAENGAVTGEAAIASLFRVDGERVVYFRRFDELAEALAAAGLTTADELID
ncbi:MAG TPA: nuclear transport factor 2 family protein [Caldilineaceae bacterium]|nr:nuclear transport factor 2 family protein [Caldilineaceae bacterium]